MKGLNFALANLHPNLDMAYAVESVVPNVLPSLGMYWVGP
jgi:hypothetical protein